jgi:MarR family transcriptional regulator, transcriptional regulator for hemolysin
LFDSAKSAGHLVSRAARLFAKEADRRLRPLGLSSGHIPVLFALAAEPVLSQKALVRRAAIEQPTMAATLVRMERAGLVERKTDPVDARTSLFRLTRATKSRLPHFFDALDQGNHRALAGLSEEEKGHFFTALAKILRNLAPAELSRVADPASADIVGSPS